MNEELMSFLNERARYLEKKRKRGVRLNYLYRIVVPIKGLLQVVIFILIVINSVAPILIPLTLIIIGIWIVLSIFPDPKEVFEHNLKINILPEIFKHVNDTFNYSSSGYNTKSLKESGLLSNSFFNNSMSIEGKDYISGKIEDTDIEIFGVKFLKTSPNYLKTAGGCLLSIILLPIELFKNIFNNNNQSEDLSFGIIEDIKLYFSGFFMFVDYHQTFNGKLLMIPKKKDKAFNFLEPKESTKVTIHDSFLNQHYDVYSSSTKITLQILSKRLIDKITVLSKREKAFPVISFINGKMYFLIPWSKTFFNVNLFTKIGDGSFFLPYIKEISFFETIVRESNLNKKTTS